MKLDGNGLAAITICVLLLFCYNGYRKGFVKEIVSTFFLVLALFVVWKIHPYVDQFLMERTPLMETVQEACQGALEEWMPEKASTGEEQNQVIESLPLPSGMKESLAENNTAAGYQKLLVSTFSAYLAGQLAQILVSGIGFLIAFVLASLLIRMIVYTLDLIAKLPVLRGLNRVAGIFVGGIKGLLFVWLVFLVLTICWNTQWGRECLRLIGQNRLLSFLYEQNVLVKLFTSVF